MLTRSVPFLLASIFIFVAIAPLLGQEAPPSGELGYPFITNYSPRDYASEVSNWSVTQDQRGILYFANGYGLLEFDGSNWRLIQLPNKAQGRSTAMDADGTVFVGGISDLGYLAPDNLGRTEFVSLNEKIPADARDYQDVWNTNISGDGVYFVTDNHIFRWDGDEMTVWDATENFHIATVANGTFYVRQWQVGLMWLENDELKLVPGGERFALERIYVMLPYDEDRVLIGTRTQGFFLFDGETFEPFRTEVDEYIRRHQIYLPGAALDDGTFAVGTLSGGLVRFDRNGAHVQTVNEDVGLGDNSVYYVAPDHNGDLWLALSAGISHVETSSAYSILDARSGLDRLPTWTIRHEGRLYVSTNDGVNILDNTTFQFRRVAGINEQVFIMVQAAGDLLAGGSQSGIFRIEGDRAKLQVGSADRTYSTQFMVASRAQPNVVFSTMQTRVLAIYRNSEGNWVESGQSPLLQNSPSGATEESEGVLWIGTITGGAYRLTFPSNNGDPDLSSATVEYFGADQGLPEIGVFPSRVGHEIYMSARGSFYRFDKPSHSFVNDPTFDIVPSDGGFYDQIWEDTAGRVWVAKGGEAGQG